MHCSNELMTPIRTQEICEKKFFRFGKLQYYRHVRIKRLTNK